MKAVLRATGCMLLLMTVLTGGVYPALVTLLAQTVFPRQANGSLVTRDGAPIGSELIGQAFDQPGYFWGRPSATAPVPYNGASSSGSNWGPTNPALITAVQERIAKLQRFAPVQAEAVPVDLVTASASGLDPHISPAAARYQAPRVAAARRVSLHDVQRLVEAHTARRTFGVLGEPRINVLQLNLALDAKFKPR